MLHTKLIVPDVHEEIGRLAFLPSLMDKAERIVFLGDWFDTFKAHLLYETLEFMLKWKDDPRITWLWGNHDCHYAFKHQWFRCSGWNNQTQEFWDHEMPKDFLAKWKIWTQVDDFLISHAGFHPQTTHLLTPEQHEEALQMAKDGGFHEMWIPGEDVGGVPGMVGGPTWLRWKRFEPINGKPQIVGHTRDSYIRQKQSDDGINSYCLDTGLHHVAWVEGNQVEIEMIV